MAKKDTTFTKGPLKVEKAKVFKQFEKHELVHRIGFVAAALIVALWINTFVLNWQYGNQLKTNILETSAPVEQKADIYLEKKEWSDSYIMSIKAWNTMDSVESLSLGIVYNPEQVELLDTFSNINGFELSRIENTPGVATIILNFLSPQTINKWDEISHFYLSKTQDFTQHVNVTNANFTDSTNTNYQLTTSWMTF